MEIDDNTGPSVKQRLKAVLSEQERAVFSRLHRMMRDALQSRGKSQDPVAVRDALVKQLRHWHDDAMDAVLTQEQVVRQLEHSVKKWDGGGGDATTLEQRIEKWERDVVQRQAETDEALQLYRDACAEEVTTETITAHHSLVSARFTQWELRAHETRRAREHHSALVVQRDSVALERAQLEHQRETERALGERSLALLQYNDYFETHYDDAYLTQKVRERRERDTEHKEAREERQAETKRPRTTTVAPEQIDAALCLYRSQGTRMIKFIPANDTLVALYTRLARTEATHHGFLPILQARHLPKLLVPAWLRCDELGGGGAVALETVTLHALDDGAPLKHAEKFTILYELVHYMAQAARLIGHFLYNQPDVRRLRWVERTAPRHYDRGVVCAGRCGVVMVDLTQAEIGYDDELYLSETDYALVRDLLHALPIPDFTHKMLALMARQDHLPYTQVLDALAAHWVARRA